MLYDAAIFITGFFIFWEALHFLQAGLSKLTSHGLQSFTGHFTGNPFKALLLGTVVSGLLHSSSAVTVMTVTLANTGSINLERAIALVLGANIGTTFTAQLGSLNLGLYALPLVIIGLMLFSRKRFRGAALVFLGLGALFLGLWIMGESAEILSRSKTMAYLLLSLSHGSPAAFLVGTVATALLQSSTAVIALIMLLASTNNVEIITAMALVLGANLGTCLTTVIAATRGGILGRQVALANVILNLAGGLAFLPLLPFLAKIILLFGNNPTRLVANFHTFYNIASSLMAIPLIKPFARLVDHLLPSKGKVKR